MFKNYKVGDIVYSVTYGKGCVENSNYTSDEFPLWIRFGESRLVGYKSNGTRFIEDKVPLLFREDISILAPTYKDSRENVKLGDEAWIVAGDRRIRNYIFEPTIGESYLYPSMSGDLVGKDIFTNQSHHLKRHHYRDNWLGEIAAMYHSAYLREDSVEDHKMMTPIPDAVWLAMSKLMETGEANTNHYCSYCPEEVIKIKSRLSSLYMRCPGCGAKTDIISEEHRRGVVGIYLNGKGRLFNFDLDLIDETE